MSCGRWRGRVPPLPRTATPIPSWPTFHSNRRGAKYANRNRSSSVKSATPCPSRLSTVVNALNAELPLLFREEGFVVAFTMTNRCAYLKRDPSLQLPQWSSRADTRGAVSFVPHARSSSGQTQTIGDWRFEPGPAKALAVGWRRCWMPPTPTTFFAPWLREWWRVYEAAVVGLAARQGGNWRAPR